MASVVPTTAMLAARYSDRIRNGTQIGEEDREPAHRRRAGLAVVAGGPLLADVLAELLARAGSR